MAKEEAEVEVEMWSYIFKFVEMAVVKCAIELGVAEAIDSHGGSISLSSLSSAVRCSPSGLYRIMRFLVNRRVFKEAEAEEKIHGEIRYLPTPLSRRLMSRGESGGMAALLLLESSPVMLAPWHGLSARLRGEVDAPFDAAHGEDIWGYAASDQAHSKLINDAMACDARTAVSAILDCCPEVFDEVSCVVDVGGGDGTALRTLIKARPLIRGVNFDLPHNVSAAPKCDGVEFVGGDMFVTVPTADAAYIMVGRLKNQIHRTYS